MVEHVVYTAAEGSAGFALGRTLGMLLIPAIGLVLLIVGLRQRSQSRSAQPMPGYPPYPQQPYGQAPGYPPPPGYPPAHPGQQPYPAAPGWGAPPPPPQKKRGGALIAVGIVLLVIGLLGTGVSAVAGLGSSRLAVGECITNEQYEKRDMRPDPVDCSRDDAIYELASKGSGSANCPDGKREQSDYSALTNDSLTYCFLLNFAEGACFDVNTVRNLFTPAPCTRATVKVDRRVDGSTDDSECDAGSKAVSYPEPKRLYCLVSP